MSNEGEKAVKHLNFSFMLVSHQKLKFCYGGQRSYIEKISKTQFSSFRSDITRGLKSLRISLLRWQDRS